MWQRIQTAYVLISSLLFLLLLNNPVARLIISEDLTLRMDVFFISADQNAAFEEFSVWPVATLTISIIAIGLLSIFLFKKRTLQMRLCVFNIILMFGLVGLIYFYIKITVSELNGIDRVFLWPIVIPFISIILTYLALKAIQKDDALVKSYERLR